MTVLPTEAGWQHCTELSPVFHARPEPIDATQIYEEHAEAYMCNSMTHCKLCHLCVSSVSPVTGKARRLYLFSQVSGESSTACGRKLGCCIMK